MAAKDDLWFSINKLFNVFYEKTRIHAFATIADKKQILKLFAHDLVKKGYKLRDVQGLKQKHIFAVLEDWKNKGLSAATLKNRASALRFLCQRINKPNLMLSNDQFNLGKRQYKAISNRAIENPDFSQISNEHVRVSLELQRVFGLRREESLKIKPFIADKGEQLQLMPTWCKGGRGRFVPIQTEEQRHWLEEAKKLAGRFDASLIPDKKTYIQQRAVYEKQTYRAGLKNLHGLRHAYAQRRYFEMTNRQAPICGGLKSSELTKEQKELDFKARMILTEELGHSREQITVNYLGR